MVSRWISMPNS